ncbi:SGNH/GDSL hydrolase family protein [Micromonospora sp. WMMD1082]|uniref:SGNH/GDSL hydrolase family protein n=1 Tax=Micromonospora sp. WMMD1082 TaxID=3016104 RepID=UPI002415E2D3|nr:SGNH/GDSL hydrolase family protein [Micromonospora sp. WMMD1082]MDG4793005.1 SGNH/GDSL hydrolase family protein [Micromonospora sp. WMMD1082]
MNPAWLPVVAIQGLWLRSTLRLASAPGGGTTGTAPGPAGTPLRLTVLGDSTAAGCGVTGDDEAFAAVFAREIAARTGRPAHWQVVGKVGATARRVRFRLAQHVDDDLDMVVLLCGGNDVLAGRRPASWRDDLTGILTDLAHRTDRVIVAGIPPFTRFPAIPGKLAHYLGERADALNAISQEICSRNPERTVFIGPPAGTPPPDFFGADRFHPSTFGYQLWARDAAARVTLAL